MSIAGKGFTLIEVLLVSLILGVMALVVLPMLSSSDPHSLRAAANATANAMRFARQESIRTGKPHGIFIDWLSINIRVYRADTDNSPWTEIYDVYDPLTKRIYDFDLDSGIFGNIESMTTSYSWQGTCSDPDRIAFDAQGTPLCSKDESVTLLEYQLTLSTGTSSVQVTLSGVTGRVSTQ